MFRRIRSVALALAGAAAIGGGMALVGSPAAGAATGGRYSGAIYQITWSLNCDSRSATCASDPLIGLGGFWGWVALMPSTTPGTGADNGQETVCGHSLVPGASPGGAFHAPIDSIWDAFSSPVPPGPVADPNGNYLMINDSFGLFPVPATYGHYAVSFEGATGQITIAP
jgi:hypothetical protein